MTYTLPTGISRWNDDKHRCDDCGRWAHEGETIAHGSRCDTPDLQASLVPSTTTCTIADVEVPTVSNGGAIDWSKIRRGSREDEAARYDFGQGSGNFDLI